MIRKGTYVAVKTPCNKYPALSGKFGIITSVPYGEGGHYGISINGISNTASKYGCFWLLSDQLIELPTPLSYELPTIKNVYFNDPVTVVIWDDGTKTIVRCQEQTGDTYSKETGLAMCIAKKAMGNKGRYYDIFKKWIPEEDVGFVGFIDVNNKKSCSTCKHRYGDWYECSECGRHYEMWETNE